MKLVLLLIIGMCGIAMTSMGQDASKNFVLNFDNGFSNTKVVVKDSANLKTLFQGNLTSNKVLGFAKSIILLRSSNYCVKVNGKNYLIEPKDFKYCNIDYFNNKVKISYTNKKRLYE